MLVENLKTSRNSETGCVILTTHISLKIGSACLKFDQLCFCCLMSRTKKVSPVVCRLVRVGRAGEPRVIRDHENRKKEDKIIFCLNCPNVMRICSTQILFNVSGRWLVKTFELCSSLWLEYRMLFLFLYRYINYMVSLAKWKVEVFINFVCFVAGSEPRWFARWWVSSSDREVKCMKYLL